MSGEEESSFDNHTQQMESTITPPPPSADSSDSEISSDEESQVSSVYGWVTHPEYPICMRKRWVIFAVAKILGRYYPLGVICTPRPGKLSNSIYDSERDDSIFASISRVICALSDQSNRNALEAELEMAVEYYSSGLAEKLLPGTTIPLHSDGYQAGTEAQETDNNTGYSFPFLVSCLLSGAREDPGCAQQLHNWDTLPHSTAYDDRNLEVNALVLDITDLANIGYGVVSRMIENIEWLPINKDPFSHARLGTRFGFDIISTVGQRQEVEDFYPRKPLSFKDYQEKFDADLQHSDEDFDGATLGHIAAMHRCRVIDAAAFDVVWPEFERTAINVAPIIDHRKSLLSQAFTALVDGTTDSEGFEPSHFDHVKQLNSFQVHLQQVLKERPLGHIPASILAHLIAMAFERHTKLTLTRFKGLSTEAVLLCLQKRELRSVRSIALCLQTMKLPLDGIEKVISTPGSAVREVFIIDRPDPTVSGGSNVESPHLITAIKKLLLAADSLTCADSLPRLHFSSAYLAALQKRQWCALLNYKAASSMTPARVRHTLVGVQNPMGRFDYCQIDTILLNPEAMVARFLHWLRTDDEHHFCGFSCGPLSLSEEPSDRTGPLPIVHRFDYTHEERLFKEALHDGWVLHARKVNFPGSNSGWNLEGTRVAYGFIRWHPEKKGSLLQVVAAKEYLNISCLAFMDDTLLSRRLHEAAEAIQTWEYQAESCSDGSQWLTDMEALNGCSLEVFLASQIAIFELHEDYSVV